MKSHSPLPVKGLGDTWLNRGTPYWRKRTARAATALLGFAFSALLTFVLTVGIISALPFGVAVAAVVIILASVIFSFCKFWTVLVIEPHSRAKADSATPTSRTKRRQSRANAAPALHALGARCTHVVSALLLGFSAPFCVGWGAAWFLACLRRNYPGELEARYQLQRSEMRTQ